MGITCYKLVWSQSKQKNSHKLTMLALAEHTNELTGQCNPSHEKLADMVEVTPRQIRRILDDLAKAGEIEISTHRGRTLTNQYDITLKSDEENRTSSARCDENVLFSDDKIGHLAQEVTLKSDEENRTSSAGCDENVLFSDDKIGHLAQEVTKMSYEPITTTTTTTSANAEVQSPIGDVPPLTVPAKKSRKAKAPTGYSNPKTGVSTGDIQTAYLEALGHAEPQAIINYGEVGKTAKKLAEMGYGSAEVTTCFWKLKKQAFWEDKHLALANVASQIAATLNGKDAVRTHQSANGAGPAYSRLKQL